ncbi:MCE family protein [Rhodococcus sp. (in: high G+C Gram-positive bacteria)]|uniref:MCE family protein n=1 Tax=Rhodococcus sp. TaxID=1831 RepID=UPI00388E7373
MSATRETRDALAAIFSGRHDRNANPILLGVIGMVVVAVVMVGALALPQLTYLARTQSYTAEFANAAGLAPNDPVYVSGVPAGRVEGLEMAGDHILVDFRIDRQQDLGDRTTAEIKLKTILGKRYLSVTPAGAGELTGNRVPLSRTAVPYSLDELTTDAQAVSDGLDIESIETMMQTLTDAMPSDSQHITDALAGVEATSQMIVRNDARITSLLRSAKSLTSVVATQSEDVSVLVRNATTVVDILAARKEALVRLVEDLRGLAATTAAFLTDNSSEIDALLVNLESVTATLAANVANIDRILATLPAGLRAATDASGNGNWVDVHAPAGPIPDNALCAIGVMEGCN